MVNNGGIINKLTNKNMKRKKEFFGVLISVFLSVFLVCLAVYATTTVGDDISVGSDLDIAGTDLQATTGTLNISKSGSTTTIKGLLNADEAVTFDTTASVSTKFEVGTDKFTVIGTSGNTVIAGTLDVTGAVQFDTKLTAAGNIDGAAGSPLILNDTVVQNVELFTNTTGNPLFKIWGKNGEPNSWGSLQIDNGGQFRFNAEGFIYFDKPTVSIEDVFWTWGDSADNATIHQSNTAGVDGQPLIFINDDRIGATVDELGEATIVIDADGAYALYIADGDF